MITSKQVNLLLARFIASGVVGDRTRMDWLYERGIDCEQDSRGHPYYEAMTNAQLNRALKDLDSE